MENRPVKLFRITSSKDTKSGTVALYGGEEPEVRITADDKTFMAITQDGFAVGAGMPSNFSIQGLSHSVKYAGGIVSDLPWPLSMLPSTTFTPLPKQIIVPPFGGDLQGMQDLASLASVLMSVMR